MHKQMHKTGMDVLLLTYELKVTHGTILLIDWFNVSIIFFFFKEKSKIKWKRTNIRLPVYTGGEYFFILSSSIPPNK